MSKKKLIFVYNADGGTINAIMDSAHKLFAPSTYQCSLCAITHGLFSERKEWTDYISKLPYETRFYHRDGFRSEWPDQNIALPVILMMDENEKFHILIDAAELQKQTSIAQLTASIARKLAGRMASD